MTADETVRRDVTSARLTEDGITRSVRVTRSRAVYADDSVTVERKGSDIRLAISVRSDAAGAEPRTNFAAVSLTADEAAHIARRLASLANASEPTP